MIKLEGKLLLDASGAYVLESILGVFKLCPANRAVDDAVGAQIASFLNTTVVVEVMTTSVTSDTQSGDLESMMAITSIAAAP